MTVVHIHVDTAALRLSCGGRDYRCAIGRGGAVDGTAKREGDGATPRGSYPVRYLYWRVDRLDQPDTAIECLALKKADGWCDDVDDPAYNRPVTLPYDARCEHLWRKDHIYDVILVIGHNDDPPKAPLGSAIFIHLARPEFTPTAGCVALAHNDFLTILKQIEPNTLVRIT